MPYIDPVTGAYVEDSLSALPPGYNQPKAGNDANVARMRAALNSGWDDNTPLPDISAGKSVSPFDIVKHAYQNMPGAGFVQGVSSIGSDMFGGLLGNIYGVGKQALQGELGNPQAGNRAFQEAQKLADIFHYTPPTKQGREFAQAVNKIGEVTGPLPELWNTRMSFTPDDLRVMGKTAVEDVRNFPMDYANTKMGLNREYPTMGSRAAEFTDLTADVARPLAEKAYEMYMNPESSVEVYGMRPGANLSGLFDAGTPMYAVKPKGGNWPTNLGSTQPLVEQGALGEYLSKVQYTDPVAVFEQQLKKHFPRAIDNRQLLRDWEDFLSQYAPNKDPDYHNYVNADDPAIKQLTKEAADEFAKAYNAGTIRVADVEPTNKKLHTASQIEQALPHYNAWLMGPFQKYITNQMGTGLTTDPLLQAVNEGGMPPHEIFGQEAPRDWAIDQITKRAAQRREDFLNAIYGYSDSPEKRAALQNSPIGRITATTPEGLAYENALDASLYPKGPYSFRDTENGTPKFPVVNKLDRNTLITDFLTQPEKEAGFAAIRKKVFQDLLSGNLDPAKLSNVTPATVTRQMIKDKMAEFKEAQLSKQGAADWIPKRAAAMPTDMAFSDGSKMTIITPEMANADEAMTARDLGQITIDLNQCVGAGCHATQDYAGHGPYVVPHTGKPPRGKVEYDKYGYLRRLKNGEIEIASLKDPKGVSQATIELKLNKPKPMSLLDEEYIIGNYLEDNNREYYREFFQNVSNFGKAVAIQNALQLYPELNKLIEVPVTKSIQQIKGHSNNAIEPEFSPHLIDWLNKNANELTHIYELKNVPNAHDLNDSFVSIDRLISEHPEWSVDATENLFKEADDKRLLPRFFTAEQFEALADNLQINLKEDPKHSWKSETNPDIIAIRQRGYEDASEAIRNQYTDTFLRRLYEGDRDAVASVVRDLQMYPEQYHLTNYSPWARNAIIERVNDEGIFWPHENPARELDQIAGEMQNMEPEAPQPQFNRLMDMELSVLDDNIRNYFAGNEYIRPEDMVEPYATDTRILMGSQNPDARLPITLHRHLVDLLLDQDQHTADIRDLMDRLQQNNHFMTEAQAENMLNMLISWTERYPLNE